MSLNTPEIELVCRSLNELLAGGSIRNFHSVDDEHGAVILDTRARRIRRLLLVATTPRARRLHIVESRPTAPRSPSAFVMLLRKVFTGAQVERFESVVGDRIAILRLDRDGASVGALVAELIGNSSNLVALDHEGRVLGCQSPPTSARLLVGARWEAPPPPPGREASVRSELQGEADLHAALERAYVAALSEDAAARRRQRALSVGRAALTRARRRVAAISRDIDAAAQADALQRSADLLQASFGCIERGADRVEVPDHFTEGAPTIVIDLDPALGPRANIDSLYRRARKLRRGLEIALERWAAAEVELQELVERVALAEASDDAGALEALERLAQPAKATSSGGKGGRADGDARLPFATFTSSEGLEILVGRGGRDNDRLTFQVARGNEIWMHAADWAGAHVVIRGAPMERVGAKTLHEAAVLAAHHCKGRNDTVVTVSYTQRKHVRRVAGAPPGMVSVSGAKALDVRIDDATLRALYATRR